MWSDLEDLPRDLQERTAKSAHVDQSKPDKMRMQVMDHVAQKQAALEG